MWRFPRVLTVVMDGGDSSVVFMESFEQELPEMINMASRMETRKMCLNLLCFICIDIKCLMQ